MEVDNDVMLSHKRFFLGSSLSILIGFYFYLQSKLFLYCIASFLFTTFLWHQWKSKVADLKKEPSNQKLSALKDIKVPIRFKALTTHNRRDKSSWPRKELHAFYQINDCIPKLTWAWQSCTPLIFVSKQGITLSKIHHLMTININNKV